VHLSLLWETFNYAVKFVAITETNKTAFLLTCIQNIAEGVASVKYCDDSLVEFLQQ